MSDDEIKNFPAAGPGGEIVPYLKPVQRAALLDWVFREIGGAQQMATWAKKSDENLRDFYRMWAKGAARPMSEDDPNKGRIEDMLARLDAGDTAVVVNGVQVIDAVLVEEEGGDNE